ncbi:hypothetical protein N9R43_00430 [bacterium]|nr:hypothetical protein [bacterium]
MPIVEHFVGADQLEFKIVECDSSHLQDIKYFCAKCKDEGLTNNASLSAIKYGKWGAEEKWWAVYHNDSIVSMCGAHYLPHVHQNCYMIAYRMATLDNYKGMAHDAFSSRMLTCFGMGRMLPYMVDWCVSKGATDIVMSLNSPTNGADPSGTMHKAHRVGRIVLPKDNKFSLLHDDFPLYGAMQDIWKLNYRNFMTMEKI